jgi:pilus assembly protein Flp/PilA
MYLWTKDTDINRREKMKLMNLFYFDEKGGGLVEYTLIIVLIALAAIAAMTTVGTKISTDMTSISNKL